MQTVRTALLGHDGQVIVVERAVSLLERSQTLQIGKMKIVRTVHGSVCFRIFLPL